MPEYMDRVLSTLDRRQFAITLLLMTLSACAPKQAVKSPKILFVCQAGTAKSAIAREMLKARAKERGIAVDVFSRGIAVEDHVSPELKQKLMADGIDTTAEPAMSLKPSDWAAADILVNFNPLPASVKHKDVRDWSDLPSVNDDYANARTILNKRIDALLTEVANRKNKP